MKKLGFLILAILLTSTISCCSGDEKKESNENSHQTERIHLRTGDKYTSLSIYEVDGHTYIVNYHGGIIHAESCPCKQK